MLLQPVVTNQIWCAEHPIRFGPLKISSRATFVKLLDGSVWVHSPIPITDQMASELSQIGEVRYVVAPNLQHHLYFSEYFKAFPTAQGFIAPGLDLKKPALRGFQILGAAPETCWADDFDSVFVDGLPVLNETAWFHLPTGTLILTDLLFCFGRSNGLLMTMVARLLGVYDRLGVSRSMKMMVKDKAAFKASIARIEDWDVKRIILAHDQIVETDSKRALKDAFAWLEC